MKINHRFAISLYGFIWFAIGLWLLSKGISLLLVASRFQSSDNTLFLNLLSSYTKSSEQAVLIVIAFGLFFGFIKGRTALRRASSKTIARILSIPSPLYLKQLFSVPYLLLMGVMVGLGLSMKLFSVPFDLRGLIDVAVGSALTNGGAAFFRAAIELKSHKTEN